MQTESIEVMNNSKSIHANMNNNDTVESEEDCSDEEKLSIAIESGDTYLSEFSVKSSKDLKCDYLNEEEVYEIYEKYKDIIPVAANIINDAIQSKKFKELSAASCLKFNKYEGMNDSNYMSNKLKSFEVDVGDAPFSVISAKAEKFLDLINHDGKVLNHDKMVDLEISKIPTCYARPSSSDLVRNEEYYPGVSKGKDYEIFSSSTSRKDIATNIGLSDYKPADVFDAKGRHVNIEFNKRLNSYDSVQSTSDNVSSTQLMETSKSSLNKHDKLDNYESANISDKILLKKQKLLESCYDSCDIKEEPLFPDEHFLQFTSSHEASNNISSIDMLNNHCSEPRIFRDSNLSYDCKETTSSFYGRPKIKMENLDLHENSSQFTSQTRRLSQESSILPPTFESKLLQPVMKDFHKSYLKTSISEVPKICDNLLSDTDNFVKASSKRLLHESLLTNEISKPLKCSKLESKIESSYIVNNSCIKEEAVDSLFDIMENKSTIIKKESADTMECEKTDKKQVALNFAVLPSSANNNHFVPSNMCSQPKTDVSSYALRSPAKIMRQVFSFLKNTDKFHKFLEK